MGLYIGFSDWTDIAHITGLQTALNAKAALAHVHAGADISSGTVGLGFGGTGATTAPAALTALGAVATTDARLSDARPLLGTLAIASGGTGSTTAGAALTALGAVATGDARLSDARTPLSHVHSAADLTSGSLPAARIAALTLTGAMHANNTITNTQILGLTITGAEIAASTITDAKIFSVDAAKVTTGALAVARGGTGAGTAATALSNLGGAPLVSPAITGSPLVNGYAPLTVDTVGKAYRGFSVNTSSTYQNQWSRVLSIRLIAQYQDATVRFRTIGSGSGTGTAAMAEIVVRLKQQNALAGVPTYSLYADSFLAGLSLANYSLVITANDATQTIGELWMKAPNSYEVYSHQELIASVSGGVVTYDTNSAFQAALPAGTAITASILGAKADVGLANVDNTSDAAKPVSTAQQTALNLKANLASPTFTGTVVGITKAMVGLTNADDTSDAAKPVSTAQATADTAAKARANHTGTQSADTLVDGTTNKAYLATEQTKLAGVATAATANATDAQLRDRSTHTGTMSADQLTDGTTNHAFTAADDTKLTALATSDTRQFASYRWANAAARTAQTGMLERDMGYQADTATGYCYIGGVWLLWDLERTSFTPVLTQGTAGNGTFVCNYRLVAGVCHLSMLFTLGTTSAISTNPLFTLPVQPWGTLRGAGAGWLIDTSAGSAGRFQTAVGVDTTNGMQLRTQTGSPVANVNTTATAPFTWTSTDQISVDCVYSMY